MLGVGDVHVVAAEAQKLRIVHELLRGPNDVGRKCRRKHAGMDGAVGQIALHADHVRVEAHRHHAVGLVENQHPEMFERQRAPEQVIEHAARRADDDMCAFAQRIVLLAIAHAAIHRHRAQTLAATQSLGLAPHLAGKLARRHENQRLTLLSLGIKPFQHRQHERTGLAAPGAGLDHHVPPVEQIGDCPCLNRHEGRPTRARRCFTQSIGQLIECQIGHRGLIFVVSRVE